MRPVYGTSRFSAGPVCRQGVTLIPLSKFLPCPPLDLMSVFGHIMTSVWVHTQARGEWSAGSACRVSVQGRAGFYPDTPPLVSTLALP